MQWITALGLERSRLTVLVMIGLIGIGSMLYNGFPKREDPEITIRTAKVTASYQGMNPQRMEELIADPVERKIREIPEVKDINTVIMTGTAQFDVIVYDQYSELDSIWQELRDKMEEVARDLPADSQGPFVNSNVGDVSIASIAITAEGFSFREMEESAKTLQRLLYTLKGIANVKLYGVQSERIWLEIDAERLAAIGVQIETLVNDLQAQNIILPAGSINANGHSIILEASGDFQSVDEIRNMLTQISGTADFVRLGDIVSVRRGLVSPKEKPVFFNGRPAIIVSVEMQSYFDISGVGADILEAVESYEQTLPIGYVLDFATFQPTEVQKAVDNAVSNVLQTVAVVLVIMMLFLGVRSGLVIATIVPLAVMFTLIGMSLLSLNLEQVSIAAIIISLGLLVDNGVVIVEDIMRRIQLGESSHNAALQAGTQFSTPLLISSLTTIFAFIPFFMMEGNSGEYSFSLGAVVAITLGGSWLAAMYFLPFISKYALAKQSKTEDTDAETTGAATNFYNTALSKALKAPLVIVIGAYVLVVLAGQLMGKVPAEMFPLGDRSQVLIYQEMPRGTDISATEDSALDIADWLLDESANPEIKNHVLYVGSGGPRFYLALEPADTEPEVAFFLVNTNTFEDALTFSEKAQRHLYEQHPEARFKIKRLSMGAGESGIVDVEISGDNLDKLLGLARQVEKGFRALPGVNQNENDWGEKQVKVVIDIDQDKARRTQITSENMASLLSAYFDGYSISEYRENDQSIPIVLRAQERNRDSAEDLLNITLGSGGEAVSLEQIATVQGELEYSKIRRINQVRTITVSAKSSSLTAGELGDAIAPTLDSLDLSGGYKVTLGGELEDSADTYGKLAAALPVAFLLMLFAIVFQFNSMRRTAIVFMSIPLVVIGVPFGLLLFSQPLSFFGNLGLISLAGIIINNAIVLIDQIDIERESLPVIEAISVAAGKRLRPILLTSATTILGLIPLYLFGGALWTPLAIVMMSGLAIASVLTLFFVPACYALFFSSNEKLKTTAT